jgi:hypothetical protein
VNGSAEVKLAYLRTHVTVTFKNVTVPVLVSWLGGNVTLTGDAALELPFNATVEVAPWRVDKRGCVIYNETHYACLVGWSNGTSVIRVRNPSFRFDNDAALEEVVVYMAREYPVVHIDVATPNGAVKAAVYPPIQDLVVPFRGSYRYAGDGWLEANGNGWLLVVELPSWKKLRIHVISELNVNVEVVLRNEPTFFSAGRTGGFGYTILEVDWEFVETLRYATRDEFFDAPSKWYAEHFSCVEVKDGARKQCPMFLVGIGPGKPFVTPVQTGWLILDGYADARIKIEVVETP